MSEAAIAAVNPFPVEPKAPAGWTYMDYAGARILIQATTGYEKRWRAVPTKKEPWTVAYVESMGDGSCLWNIGANVGSYALIAARRGHPTVAIEPSYSTYAALCNNVLANRLERLVTPICAAVADGAGIAPLSYRSTEAGAASHGFGLASHPKAQATLPTLCLSLDQLAQMGLPRPTHMLIDVDGAEPLVLAGGANLLREIGPSVLIEVQNELAETIDGLMTQCGYREAERWDRRRDIPMTGLYYARYERV